MKFRFRRTLAALTAFATRLRLFFTGAVLFLYVVATAALFFAGLADASGRGEYKNLKCAELSQDNLAKCSGTAVLIIAFHAIFIPFWPVALLPVLLNTIHGWAATFRG